MEMQEIFDTVVGGVIDQGGPSGVFVGTRFMGLYRAPDGKKCAAGQLIPDSEYTPDMENTNFTDICARKNWSFLGGLSTDKVACVRYLQKAHDIAADIATRSSAPTARSMATQSIDKSDFFFEFARRCRHVAETYGLRPDVLDKLRKTE